MGVEIERKFLVAGDGWRRNIEGTLRIEQGYLNTDPDRTVRVRIGDDVSKLTVKGRAEQLVRPEFEYDIPPDEARQMLERLCVGEPIQKRRHRVVVGDHLWQIDEFQGSNRGLIVAEIELQSPQESFRRPHWLGEEVTGTPRYYNARLARDPYTGWNSGDDPGDEPDSGGEHE